MLTEEEKKKIEEEEKVRAEAKAKYAKKPKQQTSGCAVLALVVLVVLMIGTCNSMLSGSRESVQTPTSVSPAANPPTPISPPPTNVPVAPPPAAKPSADELMLAKFKVVSATIVPNSIGTPELHVTFKNDTGKTVDGAEFRCYFYNNFDEPVGTWNRNVREAFIGQIQQKIAPGQKYSAEFNLAVYESATKVKDFALERLHFTDGQTISVQ